MVLKSVTPERPFPVNYCSTKSVKKMEKILMRYCNPSPRTKCPPKGPVKVLFPYRGCLSRIYPAPQVNIENVPPLPYI